MLSICIPVYNRKMNLLATTLLNMAKQETFPVEIILIDDASLFIYHDNNRFLKEKNIKYIRLDKNIGRAKIRNLFLKYAKYKYLLFLDCDSRIRKPDFLSTYLSMINKNTEVICGGRIYKEKKVQKQYRLRQKYGISRECTNADQRKQNAYASFMSNNFLIKKEILQKTPFDERLRGYGHEDTLFGYRLKKNKILVQHIDNPVQHDFDENNLEFIKKTEQGIKNLIFISKNLVDEAFFKEVKLLNSYEKIKKYHLNKVLQLVSPLLLPFIRKILVKTGNSLVLFDIYKLLYFTKLSDD